MRQVPDLVDRFLAEKGCDLTDPAAWFDARVAELWAEADADMSGRVDEGEFLRFAKAHADALPLFRETFFGRNLEDDP